MKQYRVNEIFYSLQGEGFHTGTPAVFVRLSGCNLRCPFCDTAHHDGRDMTAGEIIEEAGKYPAKTIILTGGEPLMQADAALTETFHNAGYRVHVETNGTFPLPAPVDWVTCSPKENSRIVLPHKDISELKVVYTGQPEEVLENLFRSYGQRNAFLQPCSGENIPETIAYIQKHPWWRLSLQTHKLIDIR